MLNSYGFSLFPLKSTKIQGSSKGHAMPPYCVSTDVTDAKEASITSMGIFDILNFYNINKRVKLNIKSFQVKNSVKFKKTISFKPSRE